MFISDVAKNSPADICGLRDGDRVIEINGTNIQSATYETIVSQIKQQMARDDLELLVLDKQGLRWYQERNLPLGLRTFPTIVHMETIINDLRGGTPLSSKYPQFNVPPSKISMLLSPTLINSFRWARINNQSLSAIYTDLCYASSSSIVVLSISACQYSMCAHVYFVSFCFD